MDFDPQQRQILLDTARQTIRAALGHEPPAQPVSNDPFLKQTAGCFVSLHNLPDHRLRGCVGRLDTEKELIAAVQDAAQSVLKDPRFTNSSVRLDELPQLEIEITIISPMQSTANCLDFDPLEDGIYLTIDNRSGCFLPQVARDTGWSREQLLSRLCEEKLGVAANKWQDASAELMKFHTLIVGPEPFERQ